MKEKEVKQLGKQLSEYKKENVCEFASNQCKGCTFSIDNGCALNLVITVLENNLSIFKYEADNQFKSIYNLPK
jgi:hypothetical protein